MEAWNTLAEVRQAIDEHKRPEWRNWRKQNSPRPLLLQLWSLKDAQFVLNVQQNIQLGHLSHEGWHARSWGVPMMNPEARQQLDELIGDRADCYGYLRITPIIAALQFIRGFPPHLHALADVLARGEEDAYIPVVAFRCAEICNQVRLRLLDIPPPS